MVILVHSLVCLLVCLSTRLYSAALLRLRCWLWRVSHRAIITICSGSVGCPSRQLGASSKETPGQTPADFLPRLLHLTHLHFSLSRFEPVGMGGATTTSGIMTGSNPLLTRWDIFHQNSRQQSSKHFLLVVIVETHVHSYTHIHRAILLLFKPGKHLPVELLTFDSSYSSDTCRRHFSFLLLPYHTLLSSH